MTLAPPDADWLQRLEARLNQAPTHPRAALHLAWPDQGSAACIGSIEPALAARMAAAGLPLRETSETWRIESPDAAGIAVTLQQMAQWLRANDLIGAWRDELLSVDDESGKTVSAIERAAVRPLGIATHAVHLIASDARGHVWVQQRAFDKATDPGLWDTTMGGLMSVGESVAETLQRETWEEAGLRMTELHDLTERGRFTVRRPLVEGYMVEHIHIVEATLAPHLAPVNQDGEVAAFECLSPAALRERLHADAFTLEAAWILADALRRRGGASRRPT